MVKLPEARDITFWLTYYNRHGYHLKILEYLPEKLNPVIRPLMESIKNEPLEQLQKISAAKLFTLTLCPRTQLCFCFASSRRREY